VPNVAGGGATMSPFTGQVFSEMSVIRNSEKLLAEMTRAEKAQLLRWLVCDFGDAFPDVESRASQVNCFTFTARADLPSACVSSNSLA